MFSLYIYKTEGVYKNRGNAGPAWDSFSWVFITLPAPPTPALSREPETQSQMPVWVLGRPQALLQLASWIMIQHQTQAASAGA